MAMSNSQMVCPASPSRHQLVPFQSGRVFVHSAFDPVAGAFLSSIILRISWGIGHAHGAMAHGGHQVVFSIDFF